MVAGIKRAIRKAGLDEKTINQRIWEWLRDNPGHTARQVGAALGEDGGNVSSMLGSMADRNMVQRTKEYPKPGIRGGAYFRYSVNPKMKEFELWPVTAAGKKRQAESLATRTKNAQEREAKKNGNVFTIAGTARATGAELVPAPPPPEQPKIPSQAGLTAEEYANLILEHMNAKAAYKLYEVLKQMFEHPEKAFA